MIDQNCICCEGLIFVAGESGGEPRTGHEIRKEA